MRTRKGMLLSDRRLGLAFLASLSAHLTVLALLIFEKRELPQPPIPVTLEYPTQASAPLAKSEKKPAKAKGRRRPIIRFSNLFPAFSIKPAHPSGPSGGAGEETSSWTDSHSYDAVGLSDEEGLPTAQAKFVRSLWTVINQSIEDNRFLSEYNHTGKVFLHFEVDENDHFEGRTFRARAVDRVLKVLAARAVRKAMKNETGDVHFPHQKMVINARFTWSSYQACESLNGFHGNFLSFCHYAENKRKTFSTGEKIATYAADIWNHGPWAAEDIKKYHQEESRRNTQFDPFEELERDPDWNL